MRIKEELLSEKENNVVGDYCFDCGRKLYSKQSIMCHTCINCRGEAWSSTRNLDEGLYERQGREMREDLHFSPNPLEL